LDSPKITLLERISNTITVIGGFFVILVTTQDEMALLLQDSLKLMVRSLSLLCFDSSTAPPSIALHIEAGFNGDGFAQAVPCCQAAMHHNTSSARR
jgi:hypothetical protein